MSISASAAGKRKNIDLSADSITPLEAYKMLVACPENIFLIDCRTRPEYEFVGHPAMAVNIPYKFWVFKSPMEKNIDFVKNVEEKFTKNDIIIVICGEEVRSKQAREDLVKAGFKNVMYMSSGFEGAEVIDKDSIHYGKRSCMNGWKHDGLPYTFKLDKQYMYSPGSDCGCKKKNLP